uniref:60S acidic ribosomal protein P2 n=1 Tax=Oncorhynchus tshawytscha TaxID=74940 RepID=A0AAZ3QLP1_ONCTS
MYRNVGCQLPINPTEEEENDARLFPSLPSKKFSVTDVSCLYRLKNALRGRLPPGCARWQHQPLLKGYQDHPGECWNRGRSAAPRQGLSKLASVPAGGAVAAPAAGAVAGTAPVAAEEKKEEKKEESEEGSDDDMGFGLFD